MNIYYLNTFKYMRRNSGGILPDFSEKKNTGNNAEISIRFLSDSPYSVCGDSLITTLL